jgi:hypothetical protein
MNNGGLRFAGPPYKAAGPFTEAEVLNMRIQFPLVPVVINVTMEWRSGPSDRWRMSLGAILILIALAAFAILPWASKRREYSLRRMKFHAIQEQILEKRIAQYERMVQEARRADLPPPPYALQAISQYRPLLTYHGSQNARYARGMSRPWVSVTPDRRSTLSDEEIADSIRDWEKRHGPLR